LPFLKAIILRSEVGTVEKEQTVPYIVFESITARFERTIKRLWISNLILIFTIIVMFALYIYRESQFEDVIVTQEVEAQADGDSDLNLSAVGGDYYGSESKGETDN
jgi:hypothetical protein